MEPIITFSLRELTETILAICGGITGVAAAVGVIVALVKKVRSPGQIQNRRIEALEKEVERHEKLLDTDLKRFQEVEEGNKVTQRALLALLSHSIDGNDVDALKAAKKDLQEFLIDK